MLDSRAGVLYNDRQRDPTGAFSLMRDDDNSKHVAFVIPAGMHPVPIHSQRGVEPYHQTS